MTVTDNELVLIEPTAINFATAAESRSADHTGRPIWIIGETVAAENLSAAIELRSPDTKISIASQVPPGLNDVTVILLEKDGEALQHAMAPLIDSEGVCVIAAVTDWHCSRRPLYLVTVPKSGTHLLYGLVEAFGYARGVTSLTPPANGAWYCLEYTNSHTVARDFFVDSVRRHPHGGRDHRFPSTPTLFMYRNPLDVVVSEANYYHREGNTRFAPYLAGMNSEERLLRLIDDPWTLGTLRDRMGGFAAWFDCINVTALSFEEIIGSRGGGSDSAQRALIWSLQLKLQIPGKPKVFADKVFDPESPTFNAGQIGRHRDSFTEEAWRAFKSLPQDFMALYGFEADGRPRALPKHAQTYRHREPQYLQRNMGNDPILVE
ncbi:MAG: hypothetical protein ACJAU6_003977 [Alphaproteobacteria bacterium]